jgi:hypothetical protein
MSIPSCRDNPFATCWTKPGAIPFQFDAGQSAESLVQMLASRNWWGAIIGPHGSGKSTLVESLKPALTVAGCQILSAMLRGGQRRFPSEFWRRCHEAVAEQNTELQGGAQAAAPIDNSRIVVVIDGFEQLAWFEHWRLKRFCRRHSIGLLVTSHRAIDLPTLVYLSPDRKLIDRLVAGLCREVSSGITEADVADSYACHGGNVREIFFDLYDRHERTRTWPLNPINDR